MEEKKKLMLVDDDADVLALLKMKLEKTGRFTVVTTTHGSKAVSMATREAPDLIILDIDMPEMSGGDVADALAGTEDTAGIPVFFLSSLIPKDEAGKGAQNIGGRRMISKYATMNQLIAEIDASFS